MPTQGRPHPTPPSAGAGFRGKRLQVWTTSCDPRAEEARATMALVGRLGPALRTVGLACLALREDGGLAATGDDGHGVRRGALVAALAARGAETALVVANLGVGGFDGPGAARTLASEGARARLVERLVAMQATERHATIELDLEALPTAARDDLVALVRALRARLPAEVTLAVDVHAKTVDDPGWPGPGAHDYGALARAGAVVRLMTYDLSLGPVPAGPTTRADWIRRVVAYARSAGVPPAQLEIGLPAYGYDFAPRPADTADPPPRPLRWREAEALRAREGAELLRDEGGAPHFFYSAPDGLHEVWFDDGASLGRLLGELRDVADDVGGVAIWGVFEADPAAIDAWARAWE